jgi:hypothetical protein
MPAQADIRTTRGIVVHDRIIAGKNGHAGLQGLKVTVIPGRASSRGPGIQMRGWIPGSLVSLTPRNDKLNSTA